MRGKHFDCHGPPAPQPTIDRPHGSLSEALENIDSVTVECQGLLATRIEDIDDIPVGNTGRPLIGGTFRVHLRRCDTVAEIGPWPGRGTLVDRTYSRLARRCRTTGRQRGLDGRHPKSTSEPSQEYLHRRDSNRAAIRLRARPSGRRTAVRYGPPAAILTGASLHSDGTTDQPEGIE